MTKPKQSNRFADLLGVHDTAQPASDTAAAPASDAATAPRRKGKRTNTDYVQISAYIRNATHKKVKAVLIFDEESGDFSDLLEHLLQEWLAQRPA